MSVDGRRGSPVLRPRHLLFQATTEALACVELVGGQPTGRFTLTLHGQWHDSTGKRVRRLRLADLQFGLVLRTGLRLDTGRSPKRRVWASCELSPTVQKCLDALGDETGAARVVEDVDLAIRELDGAEQEAASAPAGTDVAENAPETDGKPESESSAPVHTKASKQQRIGQFLAFLFEPDDKDRLGLSDLDLAKELTQRHGEGFSRQTINRWLLKEPRLRDLRRIRMHNRQLECDPRAPGADRALQAEARGWDDD